MPDDPKTTTIAELMRLIGPPSPTGPPAQVPPRPPFDIAAILQSAAKNPLNRVYTDETIHLDGYTFTNCCFNNCVLQTDTGIFALKSCLIMVNCRIIFGSAALRVIKLFNLQFPPSGVAAQWVYNAKVEDNGTITVE